MVTAVVTTYKREPAIVRRAIMSVVNQTYKDLEIIVVDDSPENFFLRAQVREEVQRISNDENVQITFIAHERNLGACAARNSGLSAARGEYIGFLDDDDTWEPNKLQLLLNAFEYSQKDLALVYSGCIYSDKDGNEIKRVLPKQINNNALDELMMGNFIGGTSCPLLKTECLRKIGGFDVEMQSAQDADVWVRIAQNYKIEAVNDALYTYYVVHEGEQISTNPAKKLAGIQRFYLKNIDYYEKHPKAHHYILFKLSHLFVLNKQYRRGIDHWIKGVSIRPLDLYYNIGYLYKYIQSCFIK